MAWCSITINRPEVLNATNDRLHWELTQVWLTLDADDARARGGGDRRRARRSRRAATSSMVDANSPATRSAWPAPCGRPSDIVYNMINLDKPVVSAINGVAVGAGLVVALLADISIMSETARITDGHTRLGVGRRRPRRHRLAAPVRHGQGQVLPAHLRLHRRQGGRAHRPGQPLRAARPSSCRRPWRWPTSWPPGAQQAIRWTKRALNNWLRHGRADLRPVDRAGDAHVHGRGRARGRGGDPGEACPALSVRALIESDEALGDYATKYKAVRMERHDGILQMTFAPRSAPAIGSLPPTASSPRPSATSAAIPRRGRHPHGHRRRLRGSPRSPGAGMRRRAAQSDRVYSKGRPADRPARRRGADHQRHHRPHPATLQIPLLSDIVLAADDVQFRFGPLPEQDGARRPHARRVPTVPGSIAAATLLTGRVLDAPKALELGLVCYCPSPDLLPRAWVLAERLARRPTLLLRSARTVQPALKRRVSRLPGLRPRAGRHVVVDQTACRAGHMRFIPREATP